MSDFKHFRHFEKNFKRNAEKCVHCDLDLDIVNLSLSNRNELWVMCEDRDCKGYTSAERKPSAKDVLNASIVCVSI